MPATDGLRPMVNPPPNRSLPSPAEAMRLYGSAPAQLLDHVRAVADVADRVVRALQDRGVPVDGRLVHVGALLHDLGRIRSHGLHHAMIGARMLREQGYPEPLCRIVERHTGAGIEAREAAALGLPVRDYTPRTLEEKVVCHADNLVDGPRRQKVQEELDSLRARGLEPVAIKMRRLHDELSDLAGRDLDEIP